MKKNKSLQRSLFLTLLSLLFVSCGTMLQNGIKQVQLDMNKQEVITKLGNDYDVVSMSKTNQGYLEILRYTTYTSTTGKDGKLVSLPEYYYYLHFLDGKLVEMNHEDAVAPLVGRPSRPRY